jgi:hypothetical protein
MEAEILFVRPSFVRGMARTLDFFGQLDDYNYSNSTEEADAFAMASDALAVSKDFNYAFKQVRKEVELEQLRKEIEAIQKNTELSLLNS